MKALIVGITGQDGSYLAELLLERGYEVFGLVRSSISSNLWRIKHVLDSIKLIKGDVLDQGSLIRALEIARPDEIYNFTAQSSVSESFRQPELTLNVTGLGVLRILEAIRQVNSKVKFYQASTSEMFGNPGIPPPFNESTPFRPKSPYAAAKVLAHHITCMYRDSYRIFACCGICFNHESPRRALEFVTRKIAHGVARIKKGKQKKLVLGNLNAKRDWGYAPEYVEAMWRMLQQDEPDDYVVATGECHSVKEFVERAFAYVGLDWREYTEVSEEYLRPIDVEEIYGDASKAKKVLGWEPKVKFEKLVEIMVEAELESSST